MGSRLLASESTMYHVEDQRVSSTDSRAGLATVIHCTAPRAHQPNAYAGTCRHDRLTDKRVHAGDETPTPEGVRLHTSSRTDASRQWRRRTSSESASAAATRATSRGFAIPQTSHRHRLPTEFAALPSRPHLLASERFHALFHSLFKVLFNFPSLYLFAIGLVVIFSLRWRLPPTSPCTRKQGDSLMIEIRTGCQRYGACTLPSMEPHSGELTLASRTDNNHLHATAPTTVANSRIQRWALPISLAVTMGIPVGFFSSA